MRRSLLAAAAALATFLAVAAPAAAASPASTHPPTYCGRLDTLLTRLEGSSASVRTAATRRAVVSVLHGAPSAVEKPATTLGHSLLQLIDHGPKSVSRTDRSKASKAGAALVAWGIRHCPTVRDKALAPRVQSSLRNGLTNAKGIYVDTDSYTGATPAALHAAEPTLHFTDGPATPGDAHSVSVHVDGPNRIVMAASTGRTCFFVSDDAVTVGTEFAQVVEKRCDASVAPPRFTAGWK